MKTYKQDYSSPFDDTAYSRQRRMGLIRADGTPNTEAVSIMAQIYAALFFESLCDAYDDMGSSLRICGRLADLSEKENYRELLIALCLEYDALRICLPEPVWWIVGNDELVNEYVMEFTNSLKGFIQLKEETLC